MVIKSNYGHFTIKDNPGNIFNRIG
jgi:hypothetical protein